MYKEIYTIPFQSINEINYKVVIEKKNYNGQSTELIGGSSPFTVDVNLESPFNPYRLSTGTLKIFGSDYLQNLFTPDPQGVRVKLLKNNQIEWLGFIANDTYSQDYSNVDFIYEIDVINPISTLKYKKFELNNRGLVSITELIGEALRATNTTFNKFYLPTSWTNTSNQVIYSDIKLLADNFIDEQDEPMSYYEILEEIAKFLNFTISIYKDDVFFLDYTGILKNVNTYEQYNLSGTTISGTTTFSDSKTVQEIDYFGDGFKLSINSGKNKAKVDCSLYDISDVIPTFDDEESIYLSNTHYTYTKKKEEDKHLIIRYYNQPKFDFYAYSWSNNGWLEQVNGIPFNAGSRFVRTATYEGRNKPASLSFTNEILIKNNYTASGDKRYLDGNSKIITFKSDKTIVANKSVYFIFNADIKFNKDIQDEIDDGFKITNETSRSYMYLSLKIGDYYYNGTNWTVTPSRFNVSILMKKDQQVTRQYVSIENKNTYDLGIGDKEGWIINAPNFTISGKPELTIYYNSWGGLNYADSNVSKKLIGVNYEYMKNISLDYAVKNTDNIYNDWKDDNNDVVYENIVSSDYIEELESEVELKICTFPEDYTKLARAVVYDNNDYLVSLKYQPFNKTDRIEHLIIDKMIKYYTNPKYEVNMVLNNTDLKPYTIITDANLPNKKFINAGNSIDYEFENNNINLIEWV